MDSNEENTDIVDGPGVEIKSVNARKKKVTEALLSLGINVKKNSDPPVIAVLGSGGGLRAMIGFLGVLSKLCELNLLGAVTYIAGISGSTWCMSSMYQSQKDWTDFSCMKALEKYLCDQIKHETERHYTKQWKRLKEKFVGNSYSLTDVWAYLFVCSITNSINEEKLSSHKYMCESGQNPYPIYCAVQGDKVWTNDSGAWFEFTPHLSGFPAHNSYIKTELLGSKFEGGHLLKVQPEKDLSYLQGMWGSAPGGDWITLFIKEMIKAMKSFMYKVQQQSKRFLQKTAEIIKGTWKSIKSWIFGKEKNDRSMILKRASSPMMEINLLRHRDFHQGERYYIKKPKKSFLDLVKEVSQGLKNVILEAILYFLTLLKEAYETAIVMKNITVCLCHWEWGTLNNFLYHCKNKVHEDCDLFHKDHICLIDGGIEINTPYPLMLPPHRKVDLILSFDFSQGGPFETLKKTAEYCEKHNILFPVKNNECFEKTPTQSCYIFEGDGNRMPEIMHFPLFNTWTCGDAENVSKLWQTYSTYKLHYEESVMKELLHIAKQNVETSIDQIRERIKHYS